MRRIAAIVVTVVVLCGAAWGQSARYDAIWNDVDSLQAKRAYSSARARAQEGFSLALKERNSLQILTGAYYMGEQEQYYVEYAADTLLARYRRIMPMLQPVERALCHLVLARFYHDYTLNNKWSVRRNEETYEEDLPYSLWSMKRFQDTVDHHVQQALQYSEMLKSEKPEDYARIMEKEVNEEGKKLRPTLFDVAIYYIADNIWNEDNADNRAALLTLLLEFHHDDDPCLRLSIENDRAMCYIFNGEKFEQMMLDILRRYRYEECENKSVIYKALANFYRREHGGCPETTERYQKAIDYCDSAILLYPESSAATQCRQIKAQIQQKRIEVYGSQDYMVNRHSLAVVKVMNLDKVYFRVVRLKEGDFKGNDMKKHLATAKAQKEWSMEVPYGQDYLTHEMFVYIPELPAGKYYLTASPTPDVSNQEFSYFNFECQDVLAISIYDSVRSGLLVHRQTGKPIAGQTVECLLTSSVGKFKVVATATTDQQGYWSFPGVKQKSNQYCNLRTVYHGEEYVKSLDNWGYYGENREEREVTFFLDRPIYKPGDTVNFSVVITQDTREYERKLFPSGVPVMVHLEGVNETVDSLRLLTNEYGQLSGSFVLSASAEPGLYSLNVLDQWKYFNVEHYKQPKFDVSILKDNEEHRLGKAIKVEGIAASYSNAPISGAQVRYSIEREQKHCWWKMWNAEYSGITTVDTGTVYTDKEGRFSFSFVPQPDSIQNLTDKLNYTFSLHVEVTDINGETHEATTTYGVGFDAGSARIKMGTQLSSLDEVLYSLTNLDGNPISGKVTVTVEQLQQPSNPKMSVEYHHFRDTLHHSLSRSEVEKRYPLLAYDSADVKSALWKVRKQVFRGEVVAGEVPINRVKIGSQPTGVYRVSLDWDEMHTSQDVFVTRPDAKAPVSNQLLWTGALPRMASVGDTLQWLLGSRYKDVTVCYKISSQGRDLRSGTLTLNGSMEKISIPVTDKMLSGIQFHAFAVKDNYLKTEWASVGVREKKDLEVRLTTFRDKIQPGSRETWSVSVRSAKDSLGVRSNLLLSMYDAALSSLAYEEMGYSLSNRVPSRSYLPFRIANDPTLRLSYGTYFCGIEHVPAWWKGTRPHPWQLSLSISPSGYYAGGAMMTKGASRNTLMTARGEAVSDNAMVDTDEDEVKVAHMPVIEIGDAASGVYSISEAVADNGNGGIAAVAVAGVGYSDSGIAAPPFVAPEHIQSRRNLSTLAFFYPSLRTGSDGEVTFSFTAPESLTTWNIDGVAWTPDLYVGTLAARTVTQKELMVVPNPPRFLRHGDEVDFITKVSNLSDKPQTVTVVLNIKHGENDISAIIQGANRQQVTVQPHGSSSVSFRLQVPDSILIASYKVVAYNDQYSDGEQALIPVLPNRMLVTESLSMYINGAGTKRYTFPHLAADTSSTLSSERLVAEFTSNPIWYAVQALPYVSTQENPSNLYRLNSFYANLLSLAIVKSLGEEIASFTQIADSAVSPLQMNEDVKQTLLEETPFLSHARSETERIRQLRQFLNPSSLVRQAVEDFARLQQAQLSDGGWSWIPDGRHSSPYVTQQMLTRYGHFVQKVRLLSISEKELVPADVNSMWNRALSYADKEAYRLYCDIQKDPKWRCKPDNIQYLYMRSFYPQRKLQKQHKEAYDFFYANAREHCQQYTSLYTLAQLALIFHRSGDDKLAHQMLTLIRERALYSDEMGMYWRDNTSGHFWYQRPIEVQSLLIEAFAEVAPADRESVARMQQWLLKQKQTTCWNSDMATVDAVSALIQADQAPVAARPSDMVMLLGSDTLAVTRPNPAGYASRQFAADAVGRDKAHITLRKSTKGTAWGAVYWQYFEDMDKVPASAMGVKMKRHLYKVEPNGDLTPLSDGQAQVKLGDRIRIRILVDCDRALEYLELKDGRASGFEPVSTRSGWCWSWTGGGYYLSVKNASTTCFVDHMEKGQYLFEYDVYANNSGNFTLAPATLQCLYAPEFRATTQGMKVQVQR